MCGCKKPVRYGNRFLLGHNRRDQIELPEANHKRSESQTGERGYWFGRQLPSSSIEKLMGERNPAWRNGLSTLPYPLAFTRQVKERIRIRDGYKCQLCGKHQSQLPQKLSIHHIDYDKSNLRDSNLISLCRGDNSRVNTNRDFWQNFFRQRVPCEDVVV